jgi:hypothetical protein
MEQSRMESDQVENGRVRRRWRLVYAAVLVVAGLTIFLLSFFSRYFSG